MGRHRKDVAGIPLPVRVYKHRACWIYKPLRGKIINLGRELEEVQANYVRIVLGKTDARLITEGIGRQLWRRSKNSSKTRGIPFELVYDDVVAMMRRAKGRCELSGIPFDLDWAGEYKRQRRPFFPSIDRIENKIGYTVANTRLVCVAVNIALNTFGHDVLIKIAHGLRLKHKSPKREKTNYPGEYPQVSQPEEIDANLLIDGVADGTRTRDNRNHNPINNLASFAAESTHSTYGRGE